MRDKILHIAVAVVGVLTWLTPAFFFAHVGPIGAYNPHYERDLGSFVLPLGIALIIASRSLKQHRMLLIVATVASALHLVGHALEGVHTPVEALAMVFFL